MVNFLDNAERICDKESLQVQLSFMALFIGMFEFMKDTLLSRVESFLCSEMTQNEEGEWVYIHNDTYKKEIENRLVEGKIVKDRLRNTMLWFKEAEVITDDDYDLFRVLRDKRNSYAHKMTQHVWDGLPEEDAKGLMDLLDLYTKLDKWWINEIEIPISGDFEPGSYDEEGVESFSLLTFKMMINTLFGGKSQEYLEMIEELRKQQDNDAYHA